MINIGIDVHKKKCHATIKGDTVEILEQTVFNNTLQGIRNFAGVVKDRYGGARAVCESTWIWFTIEIMRSPFKAHTAIDTRSKFVQGVNIPKDHCTYSRIRNYRVKCFMACTLV